MTLPEEASNAEAFHGIRAAVAHGFDIAEEALPVLTYRDDEADMCTLVEASVDDMMQFSKNGSLRLFASTSRVESAVADVNAPGKMDSPQLAAEASAEKAAAETPAAERAAAEKSAVEQAAAEQAAAEQGAEEQAAPEQAAVEQAALVQAAAEQAAKEWVDAGAEQSAAEQVAEEQSLAEQAMAAAEDAASVVAASLEDPCPSGSSEGSSEHSAPAQDSSLPRHPILKNATRMDHFQVFVAKSMFRLRSFAEELQRRVDDHPSFVADPSTSATSEAGNALTPHEDAIEQASDWTHEDTHTLQAEVALDEFLHLPVDPMQATPRIMHNMSKECGEQLTR